MGWGWFYRQWLRQALHAPGTTDYVVGVFTMIGSVAAHFWPSTGPSFDAAVWQVVLLGLATATVFRLATAPYRLWQAEHMTKTEALEKIASSRTTQVAAYSSYRDRGDYAVRYIAALANEANDAGRCSHDKAAFEVITHGVDRVLGDVMPREISERMLDIKYVTARAEEVVKNGSLIDLAPLAARGQANLAAMDDYIATL